jgi:outer membrane protein assembly factor BamE (lipoprotein component of BamABCDE complex)
MQLKKIFNGWVFGISALTLLSACSPTIDSRGYNIETLETANIQIGIDSQQTIQERLGTPSMVSLFSPTQQGQSWYYVSKKTSTTSFHLPDTLDQQVLAIDFNDQGIVQNIRKYQGETEIQPIKTITETTGYESSALRDIFGNFGRYSGKGASTPRQ